MTLPSGCMWSSCHSLAILPWLCFLTCDLCDEQHRCMSLNSHGVSKVSVIDAAGVKQVEQ